MTMQQIFPTAPPLPRWEVSHRADPIAAKIADRHYNRQRIGARQFVPPGRCIVLRLFNCQALWVTSWPLPEFTKHAWAGAWVNSCFRNESSMLSSELIIEAVAITRGYWNPPPLGIITFVDSTKVKSSNPGYCYKKAGFRKCGKTKGGLIAFQMLPEEMPDEVAPFCRQLQLFDAPTHGNTP